MPADAAPPTSCSSPSAAPPACARPTPSWPRRCGARARRRRGARARVREWRTYALIELAWARVGPRGGEGRDRRAPRRARSSTPPPPRRCSRRAPGAIRFDAPAAGNRPGRHGIWQRPVERRRLAARARCWCRGARAALAEAPRPHAPTRSSSRCRSRRAARPAPERDIAAITYGANPEKKGLDRVLAAWALARQPGEELVVAGLDGSRRTACASPACCRAPTYRALLRRARVFVCAPRREDYGIAQLEALADGCRLVTTPSRGPTRRCPLARALDARLVGAPWLGAAAPRARRPGAGLRRRERSRRSRRGGPRRSTASSRRASLPRLLGESPADPARRQSVLITRRRPRRSAPRSRAGSPRAARASSLVGSAPTSCARVAADCPGLGRLRGRRHRPRRRSTPRVAGTVDALRRHRQRARQRRRSPPPGFVRDDGPRSPVRAA